MTEAVTVRSVRSRLPALTGTVLMVGSLLLSGVLLLLHAPPAGAQPVQAHGNLLTSSEPPARAVLNTPPQRVTLHFRWRVRPGSPLVTVLGPDGATQWQQSPVGRVDPSGHAVSVDLRALGPTGRYQIQYQALTGRGTPFSGGVEFTLTAPAPTTPGGLPLVWVASVVLLTAAGAGMGVRLARAP